MIRLEIGLWIGLEIRHRGVMSLWATEDITAVIVVAASYLSVSRNPVRFKALLACCGLLHWPLRQCLFTVEGCFLLLMKALYRPNCYQVEYIMKL